ncbi:MFS transporter, putative metabolite:H+ symporter [Pseudonocardia ammonioxydans]|uniref:MFS transporter, putative metabolite:H+ symporter n=1 Tax=Pseudonocardia ammonioxydans TaxID=260086 RepID=A0A1I5BK29_PSUAM|nr:MFS transporter [Pseudonocardia ammonioxydans]SFN74949.1 MFS transporter, putative metabolite:H+ symporter [Pseudonocardia ammonioxydans]
MTTGPPDTDEPTGSTEATPHPPDPTARLDRIPVITPSHRRWVGLLGFLFVFDLVDLNSFAYAAPALRSEWGLSIGGVGAITSAGFVGMFVGAIVGGRLSDRFGRRPVLIGAVFLYSLFSLLSAFAPGPWTLGVLRVLTGLGLQAMTGVLLVWVSEMFPRAHRGRYQALLLAIGLAGVPVAAWVARAVVPLGPGAWRWIFVVGALGVIGGVVALRVLPESIRWRAARGHPLDDREEALIARLEQEARERTGAELPEPVSEAPVGRGSVGELLRGATLRRTVVASAACVFLILSFYGFSSWVPTLLVERGYTTAESLTFTSVLAIAAVPGALLAMPVIDRFERRSVILVLQVLVAVLLLLFGLIDHPVAIIVCGFGAAMFMQTGVATLYTYIAEVFPLHLRGLGSGIANGSGRLAGVLGGLLVAALYSGLGMAAVYIYLAVAALLLGLVMALFGERTTNRRLEDIERA